MNNNNNNKKSKAERRAQSQRDKANAKAAQGPVKGPKGKGTRKQNRGARKQQSAAAAYATGQQSGQAQIFRNSVDSCRIVHRELIASVTGTVAFTVAQSFPLNPGMPTFAPWLANEAAGWERYRFNKLRYCYYTRTGSNIPGSVMLAPDYDPADAAPVGEQIASSYQDCEEDAPWKDICCELPVKELMGDMKEKTIRAGALAANQDIKTYDSGNLHLCTVDGTAVAWGKLWVEYDVTLFTPQVPAGGFQASGGVVGATAMTAAAPFGTASVSTGAISASVASATVTLSNLQIGQEVAVAVETVGTVISAYTIGTLVGLTAKTGVSANVINAGQTVACAFATYIVTALNPTFNVAVTATTVTGTSMILAVMSPVPSW